ncbi:MAG: DUF4870 domain-containing protein [Methanosarcinaceae archaeon]|uniref:DUF4870 domain-containing protein n=1 Tax=Methanosarcina sp. MTP4 TaxID=1434100 RepID=UPI000696E7D7|nr:hypothetical protein [Methanosarcina sp. MTP4]
MGLNENTEAVLSYTLTWLTGLLFFVLETKSKFVRFHALQSVIAFVVLSVILSIPQAFFGELGFLAYFILNLNPALIIYLLISAPSDIFSSFFGGVFMLSGIAILLWLFLMYQAFKGKKFSLPLIGDLVDKVLESIYSE